jgi:hypothetical protein
MVKTRTILVTGIVGSFAIPLISLTPSVLAYTTVTACGYSSDGGSLGAVQIYYPPPYAEELSGSGTMVHYYGSSAYGELDGNGGFGWYAVNNGYHQFTHTGENLGTVVNYDGSNARVIVFDGSTSQSSGTFTGTILNNVPTPSCRQNSPTP